MMNNWSKVSVIHQKQKEEKKEEGIDWLGEVERAKRECKIKTKVAEIDYSKPIIHVSNKTEISKLK